MVGCVARKCENITNPASAEGGFEPLAEFGSLKQSLYFFSDYVQSRSVFADVLLMSQY